MDSNTNPTTTQDAELLDHRQGVINRLRDLSARNVQDARTEALSYICSVERKGGYFMMTPTEQDTYSICRNFLVNGDIA